MEICQEKVTHQDLINKVTKNFPSEEMIEDLAAIHKVLGEPTRLKIVLALLMEELCVCDLSVICRMSDSAISHQLRLLRNLRIVKNRRQGKQVHYRLDDKHINAIVSMGLKHIQHQ